MPKNKDPAVLFYTADFLADTTLWKYDELGRYIKLLCIQHLQDGISEDDFAAVAGGCKRVIDKFDKCEDGLYRNSRLQEEIDERSKFTKKQQLNGQKGGRPKNPNETQTKPKRNPNESPRVEDGNGNENINKDINLTKNNISFSFSNTTTTTTNSVDSAPTREENAEKKSVMVEMEDGSLAPLTDEMLAEIRAQNAFEKRVRDYFEESGFISSAELFILYNNSRGWVGHNNVDIRKNDRWIDYANEWEAKERRKQGII